MKPYKIHVGDCLEVLGGLPDQSVQCVVTSPPYWNLRDYGTKGQLGLEPTPEKYVQNMVQVMRDIRRVLRDDGTLWLNLGDSFAQAGGRGQQGQTGQMANRTACQRGGARERRTSATVPNGLKAKDLCGIPWRVALALQADGWYLRSDIIWHKPNPMPESCTDRPTKAHEYLFLLTKNSHYFYDADAIREPIVTTPEVAESKWKTRREGRGKGQADGVYHASKTVTPFQNPPNPAGRNRRSVWTITTQPYREAHFATFPVVLPERCIKAGSSEKGCCPECGAPWQRIVKRDRRATRPGINNVNDPTGMANRDPLRHVTETKTIGWRSTCIHDSQPAPCTVLDPFSGSGTTGEAACLLGRRYIGIELNPQYAAMSERRIGKALQPDTYRDMDAPEEAPLFQQ